MGAQWKSLVETESDRGELIEYAELLREWLGEGDDSVICVDRPVIEGKERTLT